jgi:hypothetical protein
MNPLTKFNYFCEILHELNDMSAVALYNLICKYNVTSIINKDPSNKWIKVAIEYAINIKGLDGDMTLYNNVSHIKPDYKFADDRSYTKYCYYIISLLIKIRTINNHNEDWTINFLSNCILSDDNLIQTYILEKIVEHNLKEDIINTLKDCTESAEYFAYKTFVKLVVKAINMKIFNVADVEPIYNTIGIYSIAGVKHSFVSITNHRIKCIEVLNLYANAFNNIDIGLFITNEKNAKQSITEYYVLNLHRLNIISVLIGMIDAHVVSPYTQCLHDLKKVLIDYQDSEDILAPQSPIID